jgi:acyl dehydratase
MPFVLENLGRWTDEREYAVTPEATIAYAVATNDEIASHLDGIVVPPMFAVVPALMDVASTAMRSVWLSEVEGYDTRSMHGEHELIIHEPIVPGMRLRSRASVVGFLPKSSGTVLITRTETRDQVGRILNTMTFVNFLRGVQADGPRGAPPPVLGEAPVEGAAPVATVRYAVDPDQSFRYADASGDYGTYHVDEVAAHDAGFPGVIVHGLCTMAFAARAVVDACCGGDSTRLKRLGVRFTSPLLPGQEITTRVYDGGLSDGRSSYVLEVDDARGEPIIRRGIAEVSV